MIDTIINILDSNDSTDQEGDEMESRATPEVPSRDRTSKDIIAPTFFSEDETKVKSGKQYVKTLFALNWPSDPGPMYLQSVMYGLPVETDISIHVSPREKDKALDTLKSRYKKADSQRGQGVTATSEQARQKRYEQTKRAHDALENTDANLHDISMYITVRSDDEEKLEIAIEEIVREFRKNSIEVQILRKEQIEGMKSVSPNGKDEAGYKKPAISGAVGHMYPFGTTKITETGGVDIGIHAYNQSPVTIRRFDRNNGYNQITAGKIGAGKTFGSLLEILRYKAAYGDDLLIFMLDPLDGFKPAKNLLDGKEVIIGGTVDINPMRITETPAEVLETTPDIDPYSEKKQNLIDFIEMYYGLQGRELGDSRDVIEMAIDETYSRADITQDPQTHSNKSPTITDMIQVLKEMEENPEEFVEVQNPEESELVDQIETHAARSVLAFNQFEEGGTYANLANETDMDIEKEDVVYFNLSQQEGSGSVGLMMHLLLSEVYERAKETDKKVLFYIDEAHYIMSDGKSLEFLEMATRHSRHHDMGINFITQTLEEFFDHPKAEAIVQQCSLKRIHKLESGLTEQIKDTLNLNETHVNFINNAEPGDEEKGYSEALYGADEHGYIPMRMYPSDFELEAIDSAD